MSVGAVDHSLTPQVPRHPVGPPLGLSSTTEDLAIGQLVEVTVIDRRGDGRYGVRINGQPRTAGSGTDLRSGTTVRAVVTRVGDRLELRPLTQTEDPALAQALAALAARYHVELSTDAQRQIVGAAGESDAPLAILRAGLYLNKVGADVSPAALAALLVAQQPPPPLRDVPADHRGALVMTNPSTTIRSGTATLGQLLERVMGQHGAALGADVGAGFGHSDSGRQQREQRAAQSSRPLSEELLSVSDGGALTYRYATLPLIVAGRLVELDMALFQQPPPAAVSPRRLVASLNTGHLGTVRIVAKSLGSSLSVALASTSEPGVAILTTASGPLRERLRGLGWQVDSIRCEFATDIVSAGREIIDHVLSTGSLDRTI